MSRIKLFTGLLIAFISGLAFAIMVLNNNSPQPPITISDQAPLGLQQPMLPIMLGESIRLPHSTSLPNASPKSRTDNQTMAALGDNNAMKSKSRAGLSIALPKPGEISEPSPAPQMIKLPLESEVIGEAPEPEELENTPDMAAPEEPPVPGLIENAPAPFSK